MFNSILGESLTIGSFATCIGVAAILGLIVSYLHIKTTKTNKNFATTLFILPILVTMVILMVNGNLGTGIAVAGAFSLVRFRSIPGNSREIMAVFFAMAIGLAVGTGYVLFASLFTIAVSLFILFADLTHFGDKKTFDKNLKILIPENLDYTDCFDDIFKVYTENFELKQAKTVNMGSVYELTYSVSLKKNINEKEFMDKLRVKNGNLKVSLTHPMIEGEL